MRPLYTAVVTPALERNLVTLDDLREQLRVRPGDVANDAWLTKVIARASLARIVSRGSSRVRAAEAVERPW